MKVRRVDLAAESEVLGEILMDPGKLPTVRECLTVSDFHKPGHQHVFEAFCTLQDRRVAIDVVTLSAELRKKGVLEAVGGLSFIGTLTDGPADIFGVKPLEEYVRIIADNARARRIGKAHRLGLSMAADETISAESLAERSTQELTEACATMISARSSASTADVCFDVSKRLDAQLHGIVPRAVWTGISSVDDFVGGFRDGQFVIVAARPAVGKTSLVTQIAEHNGHLGLSTLFFSLEMPRDELMLRLASSRAHVPSERLRGIITERDHADMQRALADLSSLPIHWEDGGRVSWTQISQRVRAFAARSKLDLVVVDYLQKVRAPDGFKDGRERVVAEAATELKNLAKELRIPVVALAQVNRDPASREDTRPRVSDLRESGVIEAEADIVLMLWRDPKDTTQAEVLVEKNRHGQTGSVKLTFVPARTRFEDRDPFDGDSMPPSDNGFGYSRGSSEDN